MGFNVTEYEKFIDTVSDSTQQLTLKKVSLVKFWYSIKQNWPQLFEEPIQLLFPFPVTYLCEARFSSCTSTKATYCDKLNVEASMRILVFSIKPHIK